MMNCIHSRTGTQMQFFMMLVLLVNLPVRVEAGFIKFRQLKEAAAAPVLVVGRVLSVRLSAASCKTRAR